MIIGTNHHQFTANKIIILLISFQTQKAIYLKGKQAAMSSSKTLSQLSKKWQEIGAIARRIATVNKEIRPSRSIVAGKGNCIVYSSDGKRFEIPLAYLRTTVFEELLKLSCEEFGFTSDERITLPCDAAVMDYVMCLLRREASEEVERALSSVVMPCQNHVPRVLDGLHSYV